MDNELNKEKREVLMAYVRFSLSKDPALLAPNLREEDLNELQVATSRSPQNTLFIGHILGKPCKTIIGDTGNVIGMYGVSPMPNELCNSQRLGVIWCLTTPELFKIKKQFMKHCRNEIKAICKNYDKVINYVSPQNTKHIRWIKAMGFTIAKKPTPFGEFHNLFYYFEKVLI